MNKQALSDVASHDAEAVKGTSIGYAINLMMDYGNGRQVTISGTLPLNASLQQMNDELDKLRLATNRQEAFVNLRNVENTVAMARKTVASIELMLATYDTEMEKGMEELKTGDRAKHSQTKSQLDNMRAQALNNKLTKQEELNRAKMDVEKGEALILKYKEEIGA